MTFLRLFNAQGLAGLVAASCLALLLVLQKGETRHWKKQAGQFEQSYRAEQASLAGTVANYRAAAAQAEAADKAAAERVRAAQFEINKRSEDALETRLADARARAQRLQLGPRAAADSGGGATASVPSLSAASRGAAQSSGENGLSDSDKLIATEQAIQLDELIKWVRRQHLVDLNEVGEAQQHEVDSNQP